MNKCMIVLLCVALSVFVSCKKKDDSHSFVQKKEERSAKKETHVAKYTIGQGLSSTHANHYTWGPNNCITATGIVNEDVKDVIVCGYFYINVNK